MDVSDQELAQAKRWVFGGLLAAVALLAVGIHHSPPVISVHPRERPAEGPVTRDERQEQESTEQQRSTAPMWWLFFRP